MDDQKLPDYSDLKIERETRDLAFLPRWSIIRTIRTQSVLEHSALVAIYADRIASVVMDDLYRYNDVQGFDRAGVMKWALTHDFDELVSADIPHPLKAAMPKDMMSVMTSWIVEQTRKRFPKWLTGDYYSPKVRAIVDVADNLERCLFLQEEQGLGNKNLEYVWNDSVASLDTSIDILELVFSPILVKYRMSAVRSLITNSLKAESQPSQLLETKR